MFDPSVQDSDFNHYVRGRIPPDLQFEIADRCPIDEQQPFGCTTDLGDWDPSDFINGLRSEPIAVEGLTRRLRDVVRMNGVLNNIDEMIALACSDDSERERPNAVYSKDRRSGASSIPHKLWPFSRACVVSVFV